MFSDTSLEWFPIFSVTNVGNPSPSGQWHLSSPRFSLSLFPFQRLPFLPHMSLWHILLCHLMIGSLIFQSLFLIKIWPDLEWSLDSWDPFVKSLRPLIRSYFLLLPGRLSLIAPPFLFATRFSSVLSSLFLLHSLVLTFVFLAKMLLFPILTLSLLTISWFRPMASGGPANCSLCGDFPVGRPCMFKLFCCNLRHSANSSIVSAAPTRLALLFPSPPLRLSLCPCYAFLSSAFFLSHTLRHIWQKLSSLSSSSTFRLGLRSFIASEEWHGRWVGQAKWAASAIHCYM